MLKKIDTEIITKLKSAEEIVILSGAGASAESGVPTFRDAQTGLWENYRPEDLATPEAFARDPENIWHWYQWRRQLISKVKPNAGHFAITKMQQLLTNVSVITQNVDGLHQLSGTSNIIEFHGSIKNNLCTHCNIATINTDNETLKIPLCPTCQTKLRPAVVWFGEEIPKTVSQHALIMSRKADVFFLIGTSSHVYPAAGLVELARENNALIIEINPNVTPQTARSDYTFTENSGVFLPRLISMLSE